MSAIDFDAIQTGLAAWVAAGTGLAASQIMWPATTPRPAGTYIEIDLPDLAPVANDFTIVERNPLVLTPDVVEAVTGDQLQLTAHAYVNGVGPVRFTNTGGAPPVPLVTGRDYWLIVDDEDNVRVADTYKLTGGWYAGNPRTAITLTDAGSGVTTIVSTARTVTPGAEAIQRALGTRRMTMTFTCFAAPVKGTGHARAVLHELLAAVQLDDMVDRLDAIGLGLGGFEPIQTINGVVNTTQFEARAVTSCQFWLVSERTQTLGIIESARVQNTDTGRTTSVQV